MFDDPRERLDWMNRQLLEDEEEEEYDDLSDLNEFLEDLEDEDQFGPGYNYAVDFGRTVFDDEAPVEDDPVYLEAPRRKGTKGLRFLAMVEIIGILAVIGWWLKWLI